MATATTNRSRSNPGFATSQKTDIQVRVSALLAWDAATGFQTEKIRRSFVTWTRLWLSRAWDSATNLRRIRAQTTFFLDQYIELPPLASSAVLIADRWIARRFRATNKTQAQALTRVIEKRSRRLAEDWKKRQGQRNLRIPNTLGDFIKKGRGLPEPPLVTGNSATANRAKPKKRNQKNPPVKNAAIQKAGRGFRVVHTITKQPLSGTFKTRARAVARARAICKRTFPARQEGAKCAINPGGLARAKRRRAEFLADGTTANDVDVITVRIGPKNKRTITIPKRGMVLIGNFRGINYSSAKFDGKWREYFHRPVGFSRVGAKPDSPDAGLVLLHPDGFLVVVPGKAQKGKMRMNGRGLLN